MQPIQINVSVNIGVTPELNGLLLSLLNRPQVEAPAAAPAPKKPRAARQQPVVENPQPEPQQETAPAAEAEQTPEPKTETAAPVEAAQENKVYTVVDVRAAMDRTRKRIEGENWKENPDSEGYKKWHRQLTAWFKNTAAICGAEKPSALPDGESCQKFVAYCDAVYVKDDELVEDCPF
ncbi:MAG: hypothetical protein IJA24_07835 [Alistipes sp.]|nr:hypothetical protein [Alistipes sp.]